MATHHRLPISKLTCGFCGFVPPQASADPANIWAPYYRAVYTIGRLDGLDGLSPDPSAALKSSPFPRLSGVGFHRHDREENYVPAHAHQRWDDARPDGVENPCLDPALELVRIRDIKPPGPEVPWHEQADYAWGFLFHEACWSVLEQAVSPGEVDIKTLWRILCSVPCGSELPNWGHNFGGLYMGTMRDQSRGEHFVLLGRNSNLVIPSTFFSPFVVPELAKLVSSMRIKDQTQLEHVVGPNEDDKEPVAISTVGQSGARDPFSVLPVEMKEMLVCYMASTDAANLRLASRAVASTPLTQHFYESRFWSGHEMAVFFDAFLLPEPERRGTDWQKLYWQLKIRLKYNRVGLGERNRLRLWNSTIKPLVGAMGQIQKMSDLQGGPDWKWNTDALDLGTDWQICKTAKLRAPLVFSETRRVVYRAEVEIPSDQMSGVHVSFMEFFGSRYITGLRFVFEHTTDVRIGYIHRGSEEYLTVYDFISGFHCATDECGFRALALVTGRNVITEYLVWAGQPESLTVAQLYSVAKDGPKKIRTSFDVSGVPRSSQDGNANVFFFRDFGYRHF